MPVSPPRQNLWANVLELKVGTAAVFFEWNLVIKPSVCPLGLPLLAWNHHLTNWGKNDQDASRSAWLHPRYISISGRWTEERSPSLSTALTQDLSVIGSWGRSGTCWCPIPPGKKAHPLGPERRGTPVSLQAIVWNSLWLTELGEDRKGAVLVQIL